MSSAFVTAQQQRAPRPRVCTVARYPQTVLCGRTSIGLVAVLWGAACAPEQDHRAAVVHEALARDNRDLAMRDPREVEARFARMARDPLSFFRGSIGLWARDITTPGAPGAVPSAFVDGVAAGVLLIGDPHPENLGTHRLSDGLLLHYNDFDVARFGPAVFDLRRLCLGFAVGFTSILDADELTEAIVDGYVAGLHGASAPPVDDDTVLGDQAGDGAVAASLFRRAREHGAEQRERVVVDDNGDLIVADAPPADLEEESLLAVDAAEEDRLRRGLLRAGLAPKGLARIVGRGVGSRPLLRYLVVLDDGSLLQLKEARDAHSLRGYGAEHERFFADNGARVSFARRVLVGYDGADANLHALDLAPGAAFTTTESGFLQNARVARLLDDVASGALRSDDVLAFASLAGRLLSTSHQAGVTLSGAPVGEALRAALAVETAARISALRAETSAATESSLATALVDHERLQSVIETAGPLLGLPEGP